MFPDGEVKKPSLSTLKRKLAKYQEGGFHGLYRKHRNDSGKARVVSDEVIGKAIELKKEQPFRSDRTINHILQEKFGNNGKLPYHELNGQDMSNKGIIVASTGYIILFLSNSIVLFVFVFKNREVYERLF